MYVARGPRREPTAPDLATAHAEERILTWRRWTREEPAGPAEPAEPVRPPGLGRMPFEWD